MKKYRIDFKPENTEVSAEKVSNYWEVCNLLNYLTGHGVGIMSASEQDTCIYVTAEDEQGLFRSIGAIESILKVRLDRVMESVPIDNSEYGLKLRGWKCIHTA